MINDSGSRTEFESGAVRDIQKGKGRCDLLPFDAISRLFVTKECRKRDILQYISGFCETGELIHLVAALGAFSDYRGWDIYTMLLEVSVHFEEGAEKYSEDNWKKGINAKNYINSGIRHFLKYLRGDDDERHDRAFVWNILCCMWTCINIPELNDYKKE